MKLSNENETISIEISEDKYSAFMTIKKTNEPIKENDVLKLIEESGIVYGFENANSFVEQKAISKDYDIPFPLAIGIKPTDAQVEFEFLFDENNCYNEKAFNNNFAKLKDFETIKKGKPVARLFITKMPQNGKDIFGTTNENDKSKEDIINSYLGENVSYSVDLSQIVADKSGYPYINSLGKVSVKNTFEINSDLDLSFENISLSGNLVINGNIKDKIEIDIDGTIEVNGDVNNATIESTEEIIINGDILNCRSQGIISQGNISFHSAENSSVSSSKKIFFSKNIHFCKIIAEEGLIGDQEESSIVGGLVQSGVLIEAALIGNSSAINTEVEISISPFTKERMLLLTKKIMELKELPDSDKSQIQQMETELDVLEDKLEDDINNALMNSESTSRRITAYKNIFSGVYVRILKKSQTILEDLHKSSFTIENGELIIDEYM